MLAELLHEAVVLLLGDITLVVAFLLGVFLLIGCAHHLVGSNVLDGDAILLDNRQEVFDGTLNLGFGEGTLQGVALKFDADGEVVAAFAPIEDGGACVPGDYGGGAHDVACAVVVDDAVCAYLAWPFAEHFEGALYGGLGGVVEDDALHLVHLVAVVVGGGVGYFLVVCMLGVLCRHGTAAHRKEKDAEEQKLYFHHGWEGILSPSTRALGLWIIMESGMDGGEPQ